MGPAWMAGPGREIGLLTGKGRCLLTDPRSRVSRPAAKIRFCLQPNAPAGDAGYAELKGSAESAPPVPERA